MPFLLCGWGSSVPLLREPIGSHPGGQLHDLGMYSILSMFFFSIYFLLCSGVRDSSSCPWVHASMKFFRFCSCAKILHTSLRKDPAQLVTTVRAELPAPHHRETPFFLSMGPAPEATIAHRVLCFQCPAPRGQQGTEWVSVSPVSPPLFPEDPTGASSLWCSELSMGLSENSSVSARDLPG